MPPGGSSPSVPLLFSTKVTEDTSSSPTPNGFGKSPKCAAKNEQTSAEQGKRKKASPNLTPASRHSPGKKMTTPSKSTTAEKPEKKEDSTSESETEDLEVSFEDYSELCERVAKTMYYANARQRCTPRPSLPLTILAVDTFTKYARKDTLEFLDIDMAAEIGRNACVSPTALVFALVYLERLSANNPGYLKTIKPSELFVVSLLVASKFVQDDGEDLGIFNDEWATSASMELKAMNKLELEFLTAIDWKVNVGSDEYDRALRNIEEKIALYQGMKRGWFTYTELKSLSNSILSWEAVVPVLYERLVEVVSAVSVMYTTLFATLISSSVLAPYLLSLSKLVLLSSGMTSSLLTASSSFTSCCLQDLSSGNNASSILSTAPSGTTTLTPHHVRLYNPTDPAAPLSLEDEENETALQPPTPVNTQAWQQQLNNVLLRHRRFYETANENLGKFSFKCEHNNCHHQHQYYSMEEPLANVQKVLENVLRSSNLLNFPNSNSPVNNDDDDNGNSPFGKDFRLCVGKGRCFKASSIPKNIYGSKLLKV